MFLHKLDNYSHDALTPEGLCNLILLEYHPDINESCNKVEHYLLCHPHISALSLSASELLQLLFIKLQDEVKSFSLKESGILFPCIKKNYHGTEKISNSHCFDPKIIETIHNTHQVIIGLTQKIRQLLDNYVVKTEWSKEWKSCVNELFLLENKILQWIHVEQNLLYPKVIHGIKPHLN